MQKVRFLWIYWIYCLLLCMHVIFNSLVLIICMSLNAIKIASRFLWRPWRAAVRWLFKTILLFLALFLLKGWLNFSVYWWFLDETISKSANEILEIKRISNEFKFFNCKMCLALRRWERFARTCKYIYVFIHVNIFISFILMLSQFQAFPFSLGIFLAFCSYSGHFSLTKASLGLEIFHCLINLTPLRGTI